MYYTSKSIHLQKPSLEEYGWHFLCFDESEIPEQLFNRKKPTLILGDPLYHADRAVYCL